MAKEFPRLRTVEFEVVLAMHVSYGEIGSGLANSPVTALQLTAFEFSERAVNADKEDIMLCEQIKQPIHPLVRFDDVLHEKIVSSLRQCWNASMKALEEAGTQPRPWKLTAVDSYLRKHPCFQQMVDRIVPERLRQYRLGRMRNRGFAGT